MNKIFLHFLEKKIVEIFLIKYFEIGIESVVFKISPDEHYKFYSKEIMRSKSEAYSLLFEEDLSFSIPLNFKSYKCDFLIKRIDILKRDEWLESPDVDMTALAVGENPRFQKWGSVGSAPPNAIDVTTVDCAIIIHSENEGEEFMIFVSEYPGLLGFTTDNAEILKLQKSCSSVSVKTPTS